MLSFFIFILLIILLLVGLAGVIFPFLPGIPFMFIVALSYAFFDHFSRITTSNLIILGLIMLASIGIDYLAGLFGAKFFGASKRGAIGGIIGSIVGLFFLPPFGFLIGLALGVFLAEKYLNNNSSSKSTKAAGGAIIGHLTGIILNLILAIGFIIYLSISYWR